MKTLMLAAVIGLITLTAMSPGKPDWQDYQSEPGQFKIKFPSTFQEAKEEKENMTSYKINANYNDVLYFVGFTIHKTKMEGQEQLAKVSLDAFTQKVNATITSQEDWTVNGNKGISAVMSSDETEFHYNVILVGQLQYQLVVAGDPGKIDMKIAKKFFKSFKLTK